MDTGIRTVVDGRVLRAWAPRNLDRATAGAVVYVHGYCTTVDDAWVEHHLPEQFAASRQNAVFIALSAPSSAEEAVTWPDFRQVRDQLGTLAGFQPPGPLVAVAHSGGFRTVASWLERDAALTQVTLLDGLYGYVRLFASWVGQAVTPARSMNVVVCESGSPRRKLPAFVSSLPPLVQQEVACRAGVPPRFEDFSARQRRARVLAVTASQPHMELAAGGDVLPIMLRRSPLPLLTELPPPEGAIA